jgi:hypothetical protein
MRDLTNLSWPEAPFGGAQRPFGQSARLVVSMAFVWTDSPDGGQMPVGTAVTYLHARRTGTLTISDNGYAFGFRATLADGLSDVPELVALADRTLVRARRHAVVLAGHGLDGDIAGLPNWSPHRLAGVTGVREAWKDRAVQGRGLARMFDTMYDCTEVAARLDPPFTAQDAGSPDGLDLLAQSLGVGLTAACRLGLLGWHGSFRVRQAVADAAWDLVDQTAKSAVKGDRA